MDVKQVLNRLLRRHREPKERSFSVWYARNPTFDEDSAPKNLGDLLTRYQCVYDDFKAHTLEGVFRNFQGEIWSPGGSAREYIKRSGLTHTSMSVGDLVRDKETGQWFMCAMIGFKEIELE